jgi:hypothetical protein
VIPSGNQLHGWTLPHWVRFSQRKIASFWGKNEGVALVNALKKSDWREPLINQPVEKGNLWIFGGFSCDFQHDFCQPWWQATRFDRAKSVISSLLTNLARLEPSGMSHAMRRWGRSLWEFLALGELEAMAHFVPRFHYSKRWFCMAILGELTPHC